MSRNSQEVGLRFKVRVKVGLEWQTESAVFNCLDGAIRFADNSFPQNEWQIIDKTEKVHSHSSPLYGLQIDALAESRRFQDLQNARDFFASQRELRHIRRHQDQARRLEIQRNIDTDIVIAIFERANEKKNLSEPIEDICWWKEGF